MGSDTAAPDERRLHPLSWLFVLITQMRHALVPILFLLLVGGGDGEYWGAISAAVGAVLLALYAVVYSFGFRYAIGADELVIREGIIDRTVRHLPIARIQNVAQRRNLLHRLFGVTELRIESAGGSEPEARMAVITVAEADELEQLLRASAKAGASASDTDSDGDFALLAAPAARETLLTLPIGELVRLGLVSNRGMLALAALFGFLIQTGREPGELPLVRHVWPTIETFAGDWVRGHGPLELALSALILLALAALALRVLSVAIAIIRHYGFVLERVDARIGTEQGLLTRVRGGATLAKIQRAVIVESLLMRWFKRRALKVDVAGGVVAINDDGGTRLTWLAPIAPPAVIDALLRTLLPNLAGDRDWRTLDPRAWRRLATVPLVALAFAGALGSATFWYLGDVGFLAALPWPALGIGWLALAALTLAHARGWARFARYALDDVALSFREGWLDRSWRMLESERIQGVRVRSSPFDRWNGMATVDVSLAGTSALDPGVSIPYLPRATAEALAAELRRRLRAIAAEANAPIAQPPEFDRSAAVGASAAGSATTRISRSSRLSPLGSRWRMRTGR